MKYALKLFYLGQYEGFQRQPKKHTIEGCLETALQEAGLIKNLSSTSYASAGRTDRGVHALSQVVAISTSKKLIIPAINTYLPENIILWASSYVNEKFHPRYDALSRYYRYYTYFSGEDIDLMRNGAKILEGIHNFEFFSKKQAGKNTIREIYQIRIEKRDPLLVFHIRGNSFLWQMVRRIVDSLLKIGHLQWQLGELKDLLEGTPKSNVFTRPRPVEGSGALVLWDVEYPFQFRPEKKSLTSVKKVLQNFLAEFSLKRLYFQELYDFFGQININGE